MGYYSEYAFGNSCADRNVYLVDVKFSMYKEEKSDESRKVAIDIRDLWSICLREEICLNNSR